MEYIQKPSELLDKITSETIKYERKIFEQRVPESEIIPVNLSDGIIKYHAQFEYDNATLSIGKIGEKDNTKINLKYNT